MSSSFIPYGHQSIDNDDIQEVIKVLKSDWLTQGPKIEEFEKAVASYCGFSFGTAFSSGTAALKAVYSAVKLKEKDEVITTPLTFAATSYTFMQLKARPVFVDIKEDLNIDEEKIEARITEKTKVIVTVDFAGRPCNYEKIKEIAQKHNLLVIQDACHALGANYNEMGDVTIFSFHPVKPITTGEGGMVITNNEEINKELRKFRNHGIIKKPEKQGWYYEIEKPTGNYRMTDIQATLGLSQLKKLDRFIEKRKEIVKRYNNAFKDLPEVILPKESENSGWHIYTIQVPKERREEIFNKLKEAGILVQVHYMPLHWQLFYKNQYGEESYPKAEEYYQRAITLPLYPAMKEEDVNRVIETFKRIYEV